MNTKNLQARLRKLSISSCVAAYLAFLVATAAIWLTSATASGSFAGGMFLACAMSARTIVPIRRGWIASAVAAVGFSAFLALYVWKTDLMPEDWEPGPYFVAVGIGGWLLATFAFAYVRATREPPLPPEPPTALAPIFDGVSTAFGISALLLSVCFNLVALRPDWISTPEIALNRYIVDSLIAYKSKENLSYSLANATDVSVLSSARQQNTFTANLRVITPVVPFELRPEEVNSYSAMRKYHRLPREERVYASLTGDVVFEKSGYGWVVREGGFALDPAKLSRSYLAGDLPANVVDHEQFPRNPFGVFDLSTRPFDPFYAITAVILITLLLIGAQGPLIAIGGVLILLRSLGPMYLPSFLTSIS